MIDAGTPEKACRTKENLDNTIYEVATTKIKGNCLFREGLIDQYPISYSKARGEK